MQAPAREPLPCVHRDDAVSVPPPEGWLVTRSYLRCDVVGKVVCVCVCNKSCAGYLPDVEG